MPGKSVCRCGLHLLHSETDDGLHQLHRMIGCSGIAKTADCSGVTKTAARAICCIEWWAARCIKPANQLAMVLHGSWLGASTSGAGCACPTSISCSFCVRRKEPAMHAHAPY